MNWLGEWCKTVIRLTSDAKQWSGLQSNAKNDLAYIVMPNNDLAWRVVSKWTGLTSDAKQWSGFTSDAKQWSNLPNDAKSARWCKTVIWVAVCYEKGQTLCHKIWIEKYRGTLHKRFRWIFCYKVFCSNYKSL